MSSRIKNFRSRSEANNLLGMTLFWSALGHVVAILSISFVVPEFEKQTLLPTLDVVLVNSSTIEAPEDPTHYAQANQDGGGESDDAERPSTPELLSRGLQGSPDASGNRSQDGELVPEDEPTPTILASNSAATPQNLAPKDVELTDAQSQMEQTGHDETERQQLTAELNEFWSNYQKRPRRNSSRRGRRKISLPSTWKSGVCASSALEMKTTQRRPGPEKSPEHCFLT